MPMGDPGGYSRPQLAALQTFAGLSPEMLSNLLGQGITPRSLLARAQGISEAQVEPSMGQAMEQFTSDPDMQAKLRLLSQLLSTGGPMRGGGMGGRPAGLGLNQVLAGEFAGSGR